ncbi:MAG TPA: hypothetical protein VHK91_11075 [Flavisolibacter sp.]|jgi:hypothetical protein|nr:hypothetical protein [Flavisolibacter sp.]
MDEDFEIPVPYKDRELVFKARLLTMGYTYKIEVDLEGASILFEKDEEKNWRAIMDPDQAGSPEKVDRELVRAIGQTLEALLG